MMRNLQQLAQLMTGQIHDWSTQLDVMFGDRAVETSADTKS